MITKEERTWAKELLKDQQTLKVTNNRLGILTVFKRNGHNALSLSEIYEQVNELGIEAQRAAIYNTLESFEAHGVLTKVPSPDNTVRYILRLSNEDFLILKAKSSGKGKGSTTLTYMPGLQLPAELQAQLKATLGNPTPPVCIVMNVEEN